MVYCNASITEIQYRCGGLLAAALLVAGCETSAPRLPGPAPAVPPVMSEAAPSVAPAAVGARLQPAMWDELPGWHEDDFAAAWPALLRGCAALKTREAWAAVCSNALRIEDPDRDAVRRFFEGNFTLFQVQSVDGNPEGLVTGYYEPLLHGSRRPSSRFRHPLYAVPDDLLAIELSSLHPELAGMRLRGRLDGKRVVPYHDRAAIERGDAPVRGKEIAWVDDPIDLFFLQVQGSGRIQLDDGEVLRVGFADQNGHPYRSIGRWLVERGELPLEQASMQGIKAWAWRNPDRLEELLNHNARFVFFRELPSGLAGPIGALGVPLTAGRSAAVDPSFVPLGAPIYLATTWPNSARPLNRLMLAQDTGGAIRGAVRADFFWGFGEEAAQLAGRMKQALKMWLMLPNRYPLPPPSQRNRPDDS